MMLDGPTALQHFILLSASRIRVMDTLGGAWRSLGEFITWSFKLDIEQSSIMFKPCLRQWAQTHQHHCMHNCHQRHHGLCGPSVRRYEKDWWPSSFADTVANSFFWASEFASQTVCFAARLASSQTVVVSLASTIILASYRALFFRAFPIDFVFRYVKIFKSCYSKGVKKGIVWEKYIISKYCCLFSKINMLLTHTKKNNNLLPCFLFPRELTGKCIFQFGVFKLQVAGDLRHHEAHVTSP